MKTLNFAKRNLKELLRDPLSLIFCLILPLFFLVIFQQFNIPSQEYAIEYFTPSIVVFSFAFISLFTAQLVAKDRYSSLLTRLFASPMKSMDYIIGYTLAFIPLAVVQSILFFITALFFGLSFSINLIFAILILIPVSILFIALGIFLGCLVNDKQAPALGSLVVQLVAFTSGMWFPIELAGVVFKYVCLILPFSHSVDLSRKILAGNFDNLTTSLVVIVLYIIITFIGAIFIFNKKMRSDKK